MLLCNVGWSKGDPAALDTADAVADYDVTKACWRLVAFGLREELSLRERRAPRRFGLRLELRLLVLLARLGGLQPYYLEKHRDRVSVPRTAWNKLRVHQTHLNALRTV